MKKIFQKISLGIFALALTMTVGISSASAALTLGALTIASDGAITLTGAVGSAVNLGTTATTGAIAIGGAQTTGTITIGVATQTGAVIISGGTTAANTLFNAVTSGTIAIGAANTGGITIGNGDTIKTISIGAGNAVNTINIGSHATPVNVITIGGTASTLGFYGVTPVVRPSAYTQTYATADKTHAARTATTVTTANLVDDGGVYSATWADTVVTMSNELKTDLNALEADQLDTAQLLNSLIDDLQAQGLIQ